MSKVQPIGDRIAVKVNPAEEVTAGGIHIPDGAKEKPQTGVVVAVGTERYFGGTVAALQVKVGDTVVFGKYAGAKITDPDGQELLILKEEDVMATINQ